MSEQVVAADAEVLSPPHHRLYIGIFPDAETAERISKLARNLCAQHGLSGQPIETNRLHVTLYHIGDFVDLPDGLVAAAKAGAATVLAAPFQVEFDRVESLPGHTGIHPLVLHGGAGVNALKALQQLLFDALRHCGLGVGAAPSIPHVTLLYDDLQLAEQTVEPLSWTVREFVLVHSELGRPHFYRLEQWLLRTSA